MISMNCMPPLASDESTTARLPAAKARMRKSARWNIGSATSQLDEDERHEQGDAAGDHADHEGVRPAHVGGAVGLDAVGDAGEHQGEAGGEGDVAEPVDARPVALADLVKLPERPDDAASGRRGC